MSYQIIRQIKPLYFSYPQVADILSINPESAKVVCSRYVKKGLLVRIKRNLYVLSERWNYLCESEKMLISNLIQVPSYISLTTALSYYGCSTQLQQDFIESVCIQRTFYRTVGNIEFQYTKIAKKYYRDFIKLDGLFIARPEKAFVDSLYLSAFGKYNLDWSALDMSKLNRELIEQYLEGFPEKVCLLWKKHDHA